MRKYVTRRSTSGIEHISRRLICACLALASLTRPASAADYIATFLTLPGFEGSFIPTASGVSFAGSSRDPLTGGANRPWLWNGNAVVDLFPANFASAGVTEIDDNSQVGFGYEPGNPFTRALLWHGSAQSVVNLHSPEYESTTAVDVDGATQVGRAITSDSMHAVMWSGSAESLVDLHPAGYGWSEAVGAGGGVQVGEAGPGPGYPNSPRAIMWTGTAASAVSLHPAGYDRSGAYDADAGRQVGEAFRNFNTPLEKGEAILWSGSAASAVSLHPSGYAHSGALSIAGNYQAGVLFNSDWQSRAAVWQGTAASVVDLHALVAAADPYFQEAEWYQTFAGDVTADGTVVGTAGDNFRNVAVIWRRIDANFNGNGRVDAADLAVWKNAVGTVSSTPRPAGDANGDGRVDGTDFLLWQSRLNVIAPSPPGLPAPEPTSCLIAVVAAAALGAFRSRYSR
jgi:hypothetical protein